MDKPRKHQEEKHDYAYKSSYGDEGSGGVKTCFSGSH